ncbi:MAG: hypothetical protein ACREGC_01695, partial [Minisyncoccia bacterium]
PNPNLSAPVSFWFQNPAARAVENLVCSSQLRTNCKCQPGESHERPDCNLGPNTARFLNF